MFLMENNSCPKFHGSKPSLLLSVLNGFKSSDYRYFLKAIKWARKYGLRINLDLHALPGSQNGWNHSGRLGNIGFLNGPMGYVNVQRSLDYIRIFAEFISQPQYRDVVTIFGIINEPQGTVFGKDNLSRLRVLSHKYQFHY